MRLVLLCFAFVIGLAGPSFAQPALMAQSEVEAALPGKTFAFTSPSGVTGTIDFAPDMTVSSTLEDGSIDKGTYRFAEGGYCSIWEKFREGAEACLLSRLSAMAGTSSIRSTGIWTTCSS